LGAAHPGPGGAGRVHDRSRRHFVATGGSPVVALPEPRQAARLSPRRTPMNLEKDPADLATQPLTHYAKVVEQYRGLRPLFEELAERLSERLEGHCRNLGLHAIVQGRAKGIASFAEKIIRKPKADPLGEIMDLCAARVVADTLGEVDRLREAVKADPGFTI